MHTQQVLKTAMTEFHKLKMHEINKIVKELWRTTYQVTDELSQLSLLTEDDNRCKVSVVE